MTGYEYFEQILKDKGLKAYDVSKGTGIRSGVFSDWKKCRYTPKIEHFRKNMRKCANADKSALKQLVGMNLEDWYWTLTVA